MKKAKKLTQKQIKKIARLEKLIYNRERRRILDERDDAYVAAYKENFDDFGFK